MYFQGKAVLKESETSKATKSAFQRNLGSAGRATWKQLTKTHAGVSYCSVKRALGTSKAYQSHLPVFKNKIPPKPIISSQINGRWQIDLINMQKDEVLLDGKPQRYILSAIDVLSRFVILRPLARKTSANVANALKRIFAEHGAPGIIQCDQGCEFKGEVDKLLEKRGIRVIRSRPYHPQSQGKCERSHRDVRRKIAFMQNRQIGFNWAQNLFEIQEAMNNHPKEVLGYRTPAEVYGNRGNAALCEEVKVRSLRQKEEKRVAPSVYRKGENVLIRYPPTGGRRVVPRRRYTCKGVIVERQLSRNLYKVKFHRPDGKQDIQWFSVVNVTGITVSKEKKASKRNLKEEIKKDQHRNKYSIPLTCRDQIQRLRGAGVNILFDPFQSTGSCQFESVAHQLSLFGIHRTAGCLRQQAVEHIRQRFHEQRLH